MSRGPMPFRSGDDAAREAVAPLLSDLRTELLVMPAEAVVEKHLDLMQFERRVLDTPRLPRTPRPMSRGRRTAFVIACVSATIASCGLSAAGALPEPLQHITDSIARTLGVPESHDVAPPTKSGAAPIRHSTTSQPTDGVSHASTPTTHVTPSTKKPASHEPHTVVHPSTTHETHTSHPSGPTAPTKPPAFPARPTKPSERLPKPTGQPPDSHSENTPPGFSNNWRQKAIDAAAAQLGSCAQTTVLAPADCPQTATAYTPNAPADNLQWSLINDPHQGAAAIAWTTTHPHGPPTTLVTVYERFEMAATYTQTATGDRSLLAYSGGIGEATMTWNGSQFVNAVYKSGSVAGHLMRGVRVPAFTRPAAVWDASVLLAVQSEFERCTAAGASADSCPVGGVLDTPSAAGSTLNGDPVSGATVTFDSQTGTYRVAGTSSITPASGPTVTGPYVATLFYDGTNLRIVSVTAR